MQDYLERVTNNLNITWKSLESHQGRGISKCGHLICFISLGTTESNQITNT